MTQRDFVKQATQSGFTHICLLADFNHPTIDWSDNIGRTTAGVEHTDYKFLECIQDCFLYQHVSLPTHFRGEQKANTLDLILTNEADMVESLQYTAPLGKSHHTCLHFMYKCYYEQSHTSQQRFLFNKGDYNAIRTELREMDWEEKLGQRDTEGTWSALLNIVHDLTEKHIPKKKISTANQKTKKPLWLNNKLMKQLKKKRQAFKRYLETRDGKDYQAFAKSRNQAKWEVRKAKRNFEKTVAA
jgi:hypothetical protein